MSVERLEGQVYERGSLQDELLYELVRAVEKQTQVLDHVAECITDQTVASANDVMEIASAIRGLGDRL